MELGKLREKLDRIDREIAALFDERMDIAQKVAMYKMEHNMEIFQPDREQEILKSRSEFVRKEYREYALEVFTVLMNTSKNIQQKVTESRSDQ